MKPLLTPVPVDPADPASLMPAPRASAAPALAEIFVYVDLKFVAKYAIEPGEYLIGRDGSCHLPIDAEGISRHHARLSFSAYQMVIEDLESSNGVFIDGVQVKLPTPLRRDQAVQIGSAQLTVRLADATARHFADALWDADLGLAPIRDHLTGTRYRVLTTVARGGMGVILQARDLRIRRTVAMKVMKAGAQFSRENVLRFIDEAQLTGQLDHPNIVPVHELGIDEQGEAFYTMKFVMGITLDEILRGLRSGRAEICRKYALGSLLTIFQKICDAVAFAHAKGVVHRDLKPENVMVGEYGEVMVMDWGLAKHLSTLCADSAEASVVWHREDELPAGRGFETMNGVVVGTPPFVSPEQARGELENIDTRSDIHVLGSILYAILTLRAPATGTTMPQILEQIVAGEIAAPILFNPPTSRRLGLKDAISLAHCPNGRIPEGLSAVALKALKLNPADRYQRVEEMQADVAAYQGGFAPKAEQATPLRKVFLFAGRHRREFQLIVTFAVVLQAVLLLFLFRITAERNRALASERRALASESRVRAGEGELTSALAELRGTAPSFAQEASALLDRQQPDDALERIDYAIAQVPNQADYHAIRGQALQTLLRFEESAQAFRDALGRNPAHASARENLNLSERLLKGIGEDGQINPTILRELHASLIQQKRVGEALAVLDQIGKDKKLFFETWRAAFDKRGMRQRFETREDATMNIDLSKQASPDLRKLRGAPVSGLNLDDTRVVELSALRGLPLHTLSLNRTLVRDLAALTGMPLHSLSLESVPAVDISPLTGLPLENLRLGATRVQDLSPLSGSKLEQLSLAGCRLLRDLTPLDGLPLQNLDLSRTGVSDLTPLLHSPLRELNLEGCVDVTDLHPLMLITTLESLLLPAHCKDVEFLREHPGLKRLSYKKLTQPVYEFWAEWDRKR